MQTEDSNQSRARWISLLAKAPMKGLSDAAADYGVLPDYLWLRQPEIGLAMVRGRIGGTGAQFNLGEMSVTRCALRLTSGEMGVAYVAGRDKQHATLAAIFDALLQSTAKQRVQALVLTPLENAMAAELAQTRARADATKVEFMTMVRGEDA